jgi:hypothetical protein
LLSIANYIDKIRNVRYAFPPAEFLSRSTKDGREDEKLQLFETLAHNLPREQRRRSNFPTYFARNPLKRLDASKH